MVSIPFFTTVNYRKESENGSTLVFNVFPVYIVRARLKFNVFAISFDARAHYITKRIVLKLFTRLWWISNYLFFFFSTETFFYFFSYCIFLYLFLESLSFLFFFFFQIIIRSNESRIFFHLFRAVYIVTPVKVEKFIRLSNI